MPSYNSSQQILPNDYDITSISYNLNDNYLSTEALIGGVLIDSESVIVNSGTTTIIVSIAILITCKGSC